MTTMTARQPQLSLVCRAVVYQMCLMMALQPAHPAFAEGIAVATGNTTLNQAGNGVPIVDIATPNGAGISHNLYTDFNVGQGGAILNNATGQLTQTQLGGLIQNNPHLGGQAASAIINEVIGVNPSQLQGYLEVAGQQAGVVVANPNGLTCDGCGFINTPTVTLSTGKPVLDAQGQLQMLDVKRGTLTVGGKGLDASRQASVDLVARAVQLNGALHGKEVNVIAGANQVNRQTGEIRAQAGEGPAPEVAIDTAALGGMYAGKIRLVSTEQGVGVNLANVVANQGDLTLDASGKIRLRDSSSAGALRVEGRDDVALTGKVQAGGSAQIGAAGALSTQNADIQAAQDTRLAGKSLRLDQSNLTSGGALALQADEGLILTGGKLQADDIGANAQNMNTHAEMTAKRVALAADELMQAGDLQGDSVTLTGKNVRNDGKVKAGQTLNVQSQHLDNKGLLKSGQALTVTLSDSGRNDGVLSSAGSLEVRAGDEWQQGSQGKSESGTKTTLQAGRATLEGEVAAQQLAVNAEALTIGGKVRGEEVKLMAGKLHNQGEVQAGETLSWQGRELENSGSLQGDKHLVLKGDSLSNEGSLAGGATLAIEAGKLTNGGRIASQDVAIDAHQLSSTGTLLGVSRLALDGDELVLTGQQLTDGELQLGSRLLQLSGQTLVGGKAQITAEEGQFDGLLKAQSLVLAVNQAKSDGKLHSREGLQWLGQHLATGQNSELIANQGVTLAGEQLTLGGTIGAGNALNIQGKEVSQSGALVSGQAMVIKADDLSLAGQVQGQSVQLTSDRGRQHGRLLASDNLVWQSTQLEGNGWMQAGADLTLSGDTLIHKGTALAQGRMALDFTELSSQGGLFARDMALTGSRLTLNGVLETTQGAHLQGDTLQLGGESRIGTDLALGATLLSLTGTQQVGGTLQLGAKEADLSGELEVGEALNVKTEALRSTGKVLAKQADIEAEQWDQLGSLAADDALVWRGARLTQQDKGVLQAGGQLSLAGKTVNLAGTLAAKGNVGITADNYVQLGTLNTTLGLSIDADKLQLGGSTQARTAELQSREGLSSGQHLIADGFSWQSDLLANKGWLQAGKDLTLTTRTLDNDGTLIAGGKHSIETEDRLTNQGRLAGNQLSLTSKELKNGGLLQGKLGVDLSAKSATLTGRLTSQGAVQLGASLLALGGNADIGGSLTLTGDEQQWSGNWRVGGLLQSTGKQLTLDGDWQASQWQLLADSLVNKGRLASEQAVNFNVGAVHNQQGATLVAGGPLTLVGKSLLQEGSWLGAGDQSIKVDDVQQHGQWIGDGALQMEGAQFNNSGALRAASMGLAFDQLTNRGRMESLGEFGWEGKQWHNLGALIAKGATLSGQHLINSGDVGVHRLTMVATDRLENNGVLVGKELINLSATTLDSQGDMLSSGDLVLGADALTLGGLTQAKNQLTLTAGQATLAGNVVADRLQWSGQHLAMGGTTVAREAELSGTQISLEGTLKGDRQTLEAGTLTTGKTSSLLAKEKQQLKADQMTLQGSIVAGQQQRILATALSQQGVLASGGSLALQVADTLRNEGKISSETLALEAGHIDNGGALVSKGALALKTGDLINRGHWQSDQGITLTATRLLNSGHWVSGLAQNLTLDELDNSGTLQSGSAMTLTAEHLNSRGKLLASQDMSLTADEIILESGSTTATNGRLALKGADVSSAGMLSAADDLSWQGQRFHNSGTTVTDGVLRLEGETLTLDGALQGETVALDTNSLTTGGNLNSQGNLVVNARGAVQHGGQLQGGNLVLNSASWQGAGTLGSNGTLTLRTGQLQQQGPWRILGVTDIQADTVTLNGSLISGGDLTLLSRGDLGSKSGSQLVSGGNLSVEGKQLTQQGLWQSERAMQIKGSRFEQHGDLLAGTDLGLRSGSWQQSGKTRANGTLNATFTENSVLAGTVQADGGIHLSAPSLTLKGTLASKGNVNLTTASQLSQLGNLLSGGELTLGAARIDQQGRIEAGSLQSRGELQNDGIMLVAGQGNLSGARLDNRGTLQGDGLTITNAQLDNRGALLANNLAIINAGVQNRGRVQGGSVRLETQSLDNQQGAVLRAQNQGDISATTLSNAGELSSGNRLVLKGNQFNNSGLVSANWLEASPLARLVNTGTLFGQQLTLRSADIHAPGKILAGQKATLEAGQVTGIGEWLSGGDLSLKVGSSLNSQGTLSAKGILDLQVQGNWQHQGQWGAGQRFNAGVTGQLTNSGALVSNGVMQLSAQRLENNGSLQAGSAQIFDIKGGLRNNGIIASLSAQYINSEEINNIGTIYAGGNILLGVAGKLNNNAGVIFSDGDLHIRGLSDGLKVASVLNSSGHIESGQNMIIESQGVKNERAGLTLHEESLVHTDNIPLYLDVLPIRVDEERYCGSGSNGGGCRMIYSPVYANNATAPQLKVVEHKRLTMPSIEGGQAVIVSKGNVTLKVDEIVNDASVISAGLDLNMYGYLLTNKAYQLGDSITEAKYSYAGKRPDGARYGYRLELQELVTRYDDTSVFQGVLSAGRNVQGAFISQVDNVTIKANAGPVSSTAQRPGMSLPQAQEVGATPGLQGDAQYLSQVLKPVGPDNGVPMPDFQLPAGDKGLFTINDSGESPYLIEVNPLLANLGQTGNGMMDRIDAALKQQLQGAGQLSFDNVSGQGSLTQATGQITGWVSPDRNGGESKAPDFQYLGDAQTVGPGHATTSGQWQQSLQNGWQGQPVSGVTVTTPGAVQINNQPVPAVVTAPVVETSPVLTQVDQFLGSNYFFDQVSFTPEKDIKLLGDAAFDTRVIRDAVLAQTGRRFINNEMGSDLAQMKALIDNAARNQRELGLSPGVALSAEQVAQLGRSMVWWEPVWYQGKIVLAPKLYLTEADKRHLSGSVITAANIDLTAGGINNSGTLLADGTLSLKSGSTLVNQGQIQAGGRLELIAKGDILNQNLIKGGDVAIASLDGSVRNETQTAQRHVDVNGVLSSELTDQTRFSRTDVGDIARIESTGNLLLQAGQDISLSASNLLAGLDMSLSAGRDIIIGSLEDRSKWEEGQNRFTRVEQLMSSLDAGRSLALSADRDLNISATSLTAKGDALLQAGNELSLKTADNQASLHTTRRNGYDIERQSEEVGVNLTASNIALRSGGDLSLRAASVQATEQLSATAGRDLLVESGETTDYRESYTKETKKKAFSKKTTTTHDIVEQHAAQASDLGGQYVLLKAQQDMDIKGSNVIGDLGATLLAGRDLNISAVDLLSREMHFSETKRSGLMGGGGLAVTIGKQQQSSDMMGTTLAKEGSSVGSVQGNVTLQAGNQLVVTGSDVIAGKDILMTGKDVAILSEQQIITRKEEFKSQKSGLTLALTGGAVTAVQAAYDTAKTSKESSNDRLVALQGTKAAMSGYQAWEALQSSSGGPGGVPDASFVGIAISVGNQRSHSSSQSSESNAFTSEINAGGDVTIVAKGDAANTSGDLLMTGSSVKGQNVTLGAARDLVLQSAVNSSDSKGSNHSSGWNVGLSIGVSQGSFGISIFANMNAAKGKENGDSDRYTETNVTAGNALTLTSGRDATLLGAMVSGDKVSADIGRNLTLTSQQDNDHYQSKQSSIAAGGSFTFGSMSGSGYINASRQKINSDFESVVEQTGVFAGKQGFDIRVGEHTQLNGAVLAGSEDDSKNRLSTGTLGWSDLVNRADYKVESQSIGISSSGGSKEEGFSGKGAMTAAAMLGGGNSSGSASSTTHASISAGQIEIRNEEAQQQDLVTLHRDPTQAANGLSPIFDKQKELERMQEAQMIGEVGQQATQLVVTKYLGEANEQAKKDPKYAQSKEYKELQAKWGVGSDFQRGMQAATAALQGLAGGDITQAAAGAAAPYLAQLIKQQTPEGPSRVMAHALVQGALAAAQNKNAMVGATGAATGELVGMLATELYHKEASQLTEGEKETVSTLATLAAGLAGGLTGADGSDVLAGAQTGKTVVENNFLSSKSSERRDVLADKVLSGDRSLTTAREFLALENADRRSEALLAKYVIDQKSMTATEIAELTSYLKIYASEMQATKTDEQIQTLVDGMLRGDNGLKSAPNREAQNIAKSTMTEWRYHTSNASIGDPVILYGLGPLGNSIKTGMLTNAAIGAGVNTAVQLAGNKNFDYIDVMVAGVTSAATTGKGMLPSIGINAGGAALGSLIKGEDPTNSVIGAGAGTVVGGLGGPLIKMGVSKITKESTAELSEAIGGAYISEKFGNGVKDTLDSAEKKNAKN